MDKLTLAQAIKQAKEAEKAEAKAREAKEKAEVIVAKVRSEESKEKIEKALGDVLEYAKSIKEFDGDLQKAVKSKLKQIVKAAFGDSWKVSKTPVKNPVTKLTFINSEVRDVMIEIGATSKETAVSRKEIESEIGIRHGDIGDCEFDSNNWSKRDKGIIKGIGIAKQKRYYTTDRRRIDNR